MEKTNMRPSLRSRIVYLLSILIIFSFIGCAGYRGVYPLVLSKQLDNERLSDYYISDEISDSSPTISLGMFYIWGPGRLPKSALDSAVKHIPGAVGIANARYEHQIFAIPFLISIERYRIKGNAFIDTKMRSEIELGQPTQLGIVNQ
jgi:hypothetical protein